MRDLPDPQSVLRRLRYHERYARYGDPMHPVAHYCELMRDWIMAGDPGFFERHVAPRRARDEGMRRAMA